MVKEYKNVRKILFISLSNIGDAVITTPVLSSLMEHFPDALISVVVGPRAREIFERADYIEKVWIYNKHWNYKEKWEFVKRLRKERYDMIVDLRHTMIPFFLMPRYRTPYLRKRHKDLSAVTTNLMLLERMKIPVQTPRYILPVSDSDKRFVVDLFKKHSVDETDRIIVLAPGAASVLKRWSQKGYLSLAKRFGERDGFTVIWAGAESDRNVLGKEGEISDGIDIMGKTTLMQLAAILERAHLMVTNDSGPMHIARASGTPVLAIFGPTDYQWYGPHPDEGIILKKDLECIPCKTGCTRDKRYCLDDLTVDEVYEVAKEMLDNQ